MRAERAAVAALAAWCAPAAAPVVPVVARVIGVPRRLSASSGIALTFDDGPHRDGTPAVLRALDRVGARATFFLVGEQVERFPDLAAEIAAAGHEIGIHGYRHVLLLRRSPRALRDDFARAADVIGDVTGQIPTLYRPPYGIFSVPALRLVRRLGWSPFLWSRWGRDWERAATAASIAALATRDLGGGDIVLLHDADHYSSAGSWRRTAAAVPSVLAAISQTGEPLVALSQSR
jgi:peptidoglycan/xylan/chitin deacetylase (PgdA/CDA1 family)